jgi:hypothetical protein
MNVPLPPDFLKLIEEGLAAARAGDVVDGEEFFDQLEREQEEFERANASADPAKT